MTNNNFDTMIKKMSNFNIDEHIYQLLLDEPYFAALSRNINKVSTQCRTAGVSFDVDTKNLVLIYDPVFFSLLTDTQMKAVLMHEFFHITLKHLTSRSFLTKKQRKKENYNKKIAAISHIANIACDMAINCHLEKIFPDNLEVPEECWEYFGLQNSEDKRLKFIIPGRRELEKYEKFLNSETYFHQLQKDKDFIDKFKCPICGGNVFKDKDKQEQYQEGQQSQGQYPCNCPNEFFNHNWDNIPEEEREIYEQILKQHIRKAGKEAMKNHKWGTVPQHIQKKIEKLVKGGLIDWKKLLKNFIGMSVRNDKKSSIMKVNPRFPYKAPGRKSKRMANIAISIDNSGSVSDQMLALVFAELMNLAKKASFTIIHFDASVHEDKIFYWKRGKKIDLKRECCGGTDFNAPTKYVNTHKSPTGMKFDGHIIITDMEASKPVASKCKRMWITTESCWNSDYGYKPAKERVAIIPDKQLKV